MLNSSRVFLGSHSFKFSNRLHSIQSYSSVGNLPFVLVHKMNWTSRREYNAALCIVLRCRTFLSKCHVIKRKTDVGMIYRSSKEEGILHCFISLIRQGIRNSDQLRVKYDEKMTHYNSKKQSLVNGLQRVRLEEKKANMSQILIAVNDHQQFLAKLEVHSRRQFERTRARLESLEEQFEAITSIQIFIGQEVKKSSTQKDEDGFHQWTCNELKTIEIFMDGCDLEKDRIVHDDQTRIDNSIQTLLDSDCLFTSKVERIIDIEGLEAEMYSFHIEVERRGAEGSKTNHLLEWIERNGRKMEEAESNLESIYGDISSFYHQATLEMQKCPTFDKDKAPTRRELDANKKFHSHEWFDSFEKKPWLEIHKHQVSMKKYTRIQEHVRIRRIDLLASRNTEVREDNLDDYPKVDFSLSGRIVPEIKTAPELKTAMANINNNATLRKRFSATIKAMKRGVAHLRQGIDNTNKASKPLLRDLFMLKSKKSSHGIKSSLPFHLRRNPEFRMMMINVKKNMVQQQESLSAISSLKFTVGEQESNAFNIMNDDNAANGLLFYQNRLELGHHEQVVLWIRLGSKMEEFITQVSVLATKIGEDNDPQDLITHSQLKGGLRVKRNYASTMVASNLQVAYSNSSDPSILRKEYEMIPSCVSAMGDCLIQGNLWIALSKRHHRVVVTDTIKLEKELNEYQDLLSEMPHDQMMQNIVKEITLRLKLAKRKRVERRGIKADPLEYISEFLLIDDKHIKQMRAVFRRIDLDADGLVSTEEIVKAMKGAVTITSLIGKLLGVILDENNCLIVRMDFSEFARGFCSLAVLGKDDIVKLVFSSVDEGGYGFIPEQRYREIALMLDPKENGFAYRALRDEILPESISFAEFEDLNGKYPNVLHPLFTFQESVRMNLVGVNYWVRKMKKFIVAKEFVLKSKF